MSSKPRKPQAPFLFGRQGLAPPSGAHSANGAGGAVTGLSCSTTAAARATSASASQLLASSAQTQTQTHIVPHIASTQHQPLDIALQQSARSSIESIRSDLLHDPLPLSFAPAMAAPPGGHS